MYVSALCNRSSSNLAPITSYSDEAVEYFSDQLQSTIDGVDKRILTVQCDGNAKVGVDARITWNGICAKLLQTRNDSGCLSLLV